MSQLLQWASQYSAPALALVAVGAGLVFVLKLVTERAVQTQFDRRERELSLRLERRSRFEEQVLLDRYKLVCEFSQRLSRIVTDLNRARQGAAVEGLFRGNEVVPLSAVFEDLAAKRFQLSDRFHQFFYQHSQTVLALANASGTGREEIEARYLANLDRLSSLANEEFGTGAISWKA